MEDRSIVIQDLGLPGLSGTALWPQTFAAVYDGHGGGQASEYLWGNLHTKVGVGGPGGWPVFVGKGGHVCMYFESM